VRNSRSMIIRVLEFAPTDREHYMAEYESETTRFLRELMRKNPELVELQRLNRATWWDKKLDLDQQRRNEASQVKVDGYAYFPIPKTK
jgi:hypothetical protein